MLMAPEQDIFAWAQAMIQHKLVPEGLDTPEKVILCACAGREFGISPFQAVNDFYVVKGRIGVMTQFMVSRLHGAGHRLIIDQQSTERATVTITRREGQSNTVTVTWADAEAAGWHKTQNGIKPTWAGQGRKTMLTYRAVSINIRQFCPEVLRRPTGEVMATADEIADNAGDPSENVLTARIHFLEKANEALMERIRAYEAVPANVTPPAEGPLTEKRTASLGELGEAKRAKFMAGACAYYGFTTAEALLALGVADLAQVDISPVAAKGRISAWVEARATEKARSEPETAEEPTLAGTELPWPQ